MTNSEIDLIDAREICALLRCCRRTFGRMLAAGEFPPPIRIAALRRWDRATVLRWLRAQQPETVGATR